METFRNNQQIEYGLYWCKRAKLSFDISDQLFFIGSYFDVTQDKLCRQPDTNLQFSSDQPADRYREDKTFN